MNKTSTPAGNGRWKRPSAAVNGPVRNAGGFYRTAEGEGREHGGVPLATANAAVVAAVRLAYQVAEAQIDRSTRLARRLREAGDREVGSRSDEKVLDATEQLVMKTLLSGLEWWESSVAEGRCPVKRLAAAEYQMLGTVLGFETLRGARKASGARASAPTPAAPVPSPRAREAAAHGKLQVVLKGPAKNRRRVSVVGWELSATGSFHNKVYFHPAREGAGEPLEADVAVGPERTVQLTIETPPGLQPGHWTCAICDLADVQVGYIEISL